MKLSFLLQICSSNWIVVLAAKDNKYLGNFAHSQIRFHKYTENLLWNITAITITYFLSVINKLLLSRSSNCIGESKSIYFLTSLCTNWTVNCCGKCGWFLKDDLTWSCKSSKSFFKIKFRDIPYLITKVIGSGVVPCIKKMKLEKQILSKRKLIVKYTGKI